MKIGANCNTGVLTADTIVVTVYSKYKDYCSFLSRTLLINPIDEQKVAYNFLIEVMAFLKETVKVGKPCE